MIVVKTRSWTLGDGEWLLRRMAALRSEVIQLRSMDSKTQVEFYGARNPHDHSMFETEVFVENSPLKTKTAQFLIVPLLKNVCVLINWNARKPYPA